MMACAFPIHHRNTHTTYSQNTLHSIDNCVVATVTDSHFEHSNKVGTFWEILFRYGKKGDSGVQHYINSHKIY